MPVAVIMMWKPWRQCCLMFAMLGVAGWIEPVHQRAEAARPMEALASAILIEDVDGSRCIAHADGREFATPGRDVLAAALGLQNRSDQSVWSTGPVAGEVRHFRIVFLRAVPIGTICSTAETVAILKDDAQVPGDVRDDSQWQTLGSGQVRALPVKTMVRAIRVTLRHHNLPWEAGRPPTVFPGLWLLKGRFFNPTEFGRRDWVLASPEAKPDAARAPASKMWQWGGYWPAIREVAGVLLCGTGIESPTVGVLQKADEASGLLHPRLAKPSDWKPVSIQRNGAVLAFGTPVATHALRLVSDRTEKQSRASELPEVMPLVALSDDDDAPSSRSFSFIEPAPVALQYDMPLDGFVAVRIEDSQGRYVRRLIAEVERDRGMVREPWDLRDDAGQLVAPGSYRFTGLARPRLKLTYEMTVYNAGSPPWIAPVPGGGWWMADHSPPTAVCAVKNVLFFGAFGAEFGVPLIATDLEGKKLWHDLHQGVERLVSDGRYAYVVNRDNVVRIDPENQFAKEIVHQFQYTDTLPGHATGYVLADRSGAAAFGKTLAVSYSGASPPWIRSAVKGHEIDLPRCFPKPLPRKVHVTEMNPDEFILSTFQTMTSSTAAVFGPAPKKGPLAKTMLLTLTREVPVGSIVLPRDDIEVWALRPGKKLPPQFIPPETTADPTAQPVKPNDDLAADVLGDLQSRFDPQVWVRLQLPTIQGRAAGSKTQPTRAAVAVPESGLMTRVLAFTSPTLQQLDYSLILDRRYRNATPQAKFICLEGQATDARDWELRRLPEQPLSYGNPAIAGYVWSEPKSLRGFLLTRPLEWSGIAVDVWNGPAEATIDEAAFRNNDLWRQVHLHRQTRDHVKFSWHTNRTIIGDFDELLSVRAIRVRVVEPPNGPGARSGATVIGGFESLVTFEPLGNDPELPTDLAQRVTVLDLPSAGRQTATVRAHLPLPHPSALAFDRQGRLFAACDDGIVAITVAELLRDSETGSRNDAAMIIPRAESGKPRALAFDKDGLLYLLDGAAQRVRVFNVDSGKLVREFGQPGGGVGPYDPRELSVPVAMVFDPDDKLWIVEQHFQPKRISRWSKIGQVEKQLFGPTHYGGGGMLDGGDKTVINHLGMKFRIDYATRTWKLESRLAAYGCGHYLPDRVTYVAGRRFLIGDRPTVTPFGDAGPTSVICEERDGVAVPIVASGVLGDWKEFPKHAELQQSARDINPAETAFVWSDGNGDSQVQLEEVQLLRGFTTNRAPYIGDDLSLNFSKAQGGVRLRSHPARHDESNAPPKSVGPTARHAERDGSIGAPRYDVAKIESIRELTDEVWVSGSGETLVMSHKMLDDKGQLRWTYPDNYRGVQASNQTPWGFYNRPPGVVCGSFGLIGQFDIAGESLFCVGGNNGDYYAFTRDGLLAASILGGPRGYGRRFFSMPDCEPGKTDLSDLRKTVEDFHGHVTRADDGHVYAIAGKNHVSLIRVDGLEQMQRFNGSIEVTRDDLSRTQQWSATKSRLERFLDDDGSKRAAVAFLKKPPTIDGDVLTDWPEQDWTTIHTSRNVQGKVVQLTQSRLAFDADHLYVAATTLDNSPLLNGATDLAVLFQHGDAFDLHLGLDPKATPDRNDAEPGDVRVLISARGETPVTMLYRYVDGPKKSSTGSQPRVFRSPVGETHVASIRELTEARVAIVRSDKGWTIEAAIPWKSLGTTAPNQALILRGDLGILESDPNGQSTVARYYWANKRQVTLGDQPAEARVIPSLWGEFEFTVPNLIDALLDP